MHFCTFIWLCPKNTLHMIYGIEYCTVEITCEDVTQYGIQACGHEARSSQEALGHYMLEPLAYNIF